MESKTLIFTQKESEGSQLIPQNCLQRYLYSDIHEFCFAEFLVVLQEWLSELATRQTNFQRRGVAEWTDKLTQVAQVSNPISRAVDFWIDRILEGYVTEFIVEAITSYCEVERHFFQGPWGRYLMSVNLWIKMLPYEKSILKLSD